MAIQNWSDKIVVGELADDPQFCDELNTLIETCQERPSDVVLNFSAVAFINSSNLSRLLRMRKMLSGQHRRMILCAVNSQVWGVFMLTGLDKVFEFTNDMATALATLQMSQPNSKK